jgi:hypothetical protein
MLVAINTKRNNRLYKSINVHNDLSLQETENNRWIAPDYMIEDYGDFIKGEEIELTYIKPTQYIKGDKVIGKCSFFKCSKYNTNIKFKEVNKNHERVSNFIFNYILENKNNIKFKISNKINNEFNEDFYNISLDDLKPDFLKMDFEVTLKDSDIKRRADIFIPINSKNEIFGKAICIEIQLSSQTYEKTEERTLHRAYLGMSTIWIRNQDLKIEETQIFLKNEELEIFPYIHVLDKANEKATEIIRLEYERQGILVDKKMEEVNKVIENYNKCFDPLDFKLCQKCLNGILVLRRRKTDNKPFIGCTNFECNNIINLE